MNKSVIDILKFFKNVQYKILRGIKDLKNNNNNKF